MAPRNRKERRAAATAQADDDTFDASSIPLAQPTGKKSSSSSSNKKAKTLYELAAERQAELLASSGGGGGNTPNSAPPLSAEPGMEFVKISPTGEVSQYDPSPHPADGSSSSPQTGAAGTEEIENVDLPPLLDTILLSLPLSALHFTLSFLAAHQYAQEIPLRKLIRDTILFSFPILSFIIHLAHGHIISLDDIFKFRGGRSSSSSKKKEKGKKDAKDGPKKQKQKQEEKEISLLFRISTLIFPPTLRTLILLSAAIFLGAKLIATTNEASYYAVMKTAPSIGTLWVWCVLEMSAGAALLAFLIPVTWAVGWMGYRVV
ncbi:hypothetical protein AJ80_06950 [Polytolypa hystricis UAMH7299]|uniref:DUF7719 domain-containing protein n=1 Tax=Polytolypa hystricis (strain UAMH7299) TaxID=1447883 RepID=A0A2B7XSF6_POLH7|nr:hypothetical protein AJ80_06950 [Polytolypa hystricis UAMH7299]